MLESLVAAGACDSLGGHRKQLIEALRILKDGGWVKVSFSAPPGRPGTATVTELTDLGRFAMQFVQPDKDKP